MTDRVEALRRTLLAHRPADPREAGSRRRILAFLDWLPAPFDEDADPTHVTASAVVVGPDRRVLVHRHKRLGRWLQPGGHLGPDEAPDDAAVRETLEETGVRAVHPDGRPRLVHVDVHEGPRGHVHLDLRYLLLAGAVAVRPGDGESPDADWWEAPAVLAHGDGSLGRAVDAARRWLEVAPGIRTAADAAPPPRATDRGRPPRS